MQPDIKVRSRKYVLKGSQALGAWSLNLKHVVIELIQLTFTEITQFKSAAILFNKQSATGPWLELSNEILCILPAHGAEVKFGVKNMFAPLALQYT